MQRQQRAGHIHHGIDPAQLVKVNRLDRHAVNAGLGLGHPLKDAQGTFLNVAGSRLAAIISAISVRPRA